MLYRRFGKTEIMMPVLSFGCMRSMSSWQDDGAEAIPADAQANLAQILKTALDHGINHIETAHGYGTSERQLGKILPGLQRDEIILQTKATPSADPDEFTARVHRSLERLRVDRVDLLALHGINDFRTLWYSCRSGGCLAAARKLQDRGLVGHVGFSGHGPLDVILAALAHRDEGGFDYANIHWYYIFDANRAAIDAAAERDIGIFIISPTDKGGQLHRPPSRLVELCAPLSPMMFNDAYCLSRPGVQTISVGAAQPDQFAEHLRAVALLEQDQGESLAQIDTRLQEEMFARTGRRRPDEWWNVLPPWDRAPGSVNLRMVTWLYDLYRGWGLETYARERYAMLNRGSDWVPGNDGAAAERLDFSGVETSTGISGDRLRHLVVEAHDVLMQHSRKRT